ncbi:Protein of unknown function (DUF3505) domain containing protein [Rhypophila sp. PSN 637]
MEPFVHLPEYPFVICQTCGYACVANEVATHLGKQHHEIEPKERSRIAKLVEEIPGIIPNQAGLCGFRFPPATTEPIPFIAAPEIDGIRCNECGFVIRTTQGIQKHCRREHGWKNDWSRGGNVTKRARQLRALPWTTGVHCQRFFRSRAASRWFEVNRGSRGSQVAVISAPEETVEQRITQIHKAQAKKFEEKKQQIVQVGNEKAEPNPWLRRVGWAEHLQGLDRERLRESMRPIGEDEATLQRMWDSLSRVIDQARAVAVPMRVGHAVLFEVNRKEAHMKATKPFDSRMEDDTWVRYREVMRKLLCFIQRTQDWEDEARPRYMLTQKQGSLYDAFEDVAEQYGQQGVDEMVHPSALASVQAIDRLCLDTVVSLLDHQYTHSHYESAMISGLAVMGIREDGGWESVENYTPIYSAVIKMARMLVVYQAVLEQQDEIKELEQRMSKEEAKAAATGLFTIVRKKVRRFLVVVGEKTEPGPIDWIFDARTYGMRIRYTMTAAPAIDWVGERISCLTRSRVLA